MGGVAVTHIDPIVAELLASLQRLGASQLTIAERAGISAPYLNQIAKGKRQPTLDVIHRLADVAGRRLSVQRGRRATNNLESTK
jgi:transcriptional regulator with XRE-family HTH domain